MTLPTKRGRPPEDRAARRRQIYEAVGPLILAEGPRALTMRDVARTACISVSNLYNYFPCKEELVLYGLHEEPLRWFCVEARRACEAAVATGGVDAVMRAWAETTAARVDFIRPAVHAAVALGADTFWATLDRGILEGLHGFAQTLAAVLGEHADRDLTTLGRSLRRAILAAVMDRRCTHAELADDLLLRMRQFGIGATASMPGQVQGARRRLQAVGRP